MIFIRSVMILVLSSLSAASLLSCHTNWQGTNRPFSSQHLAFTLSPQWEQKLGTLTFRRMAHSIVVRFPAIDEIPPVKGSGEVTFRRMRNAFASPERIIDTEQPGTWQGRQKLDLTWHGKTKKGASVRGKQRFVMLKSGVVAVLWYVPTSEWDSARDEMAQIEARMRLK